MNKKFILTFLIITAFCFGLFKAFAYNSNKEIDMSEKKVLIAYYSYSGNTKAAALKIQSVTGGDLFEIETKSQYPKDYNQVVNQAKIEKEQDIKPDLKDNGSVEGYDIIFVGTPVWWYTMAPAVKTFLSNNNFSGKVIVPFCTHGGGGASSTYTDMQKLVPDTKILNGYTTYETSANTNDIKKWISSLNF